MKITAKKLLLGEYNIPHEGKKTIIITKEKLQSLLKPELYIANEIRDDFTFDLEDILCVIRNFQIEEQDNGGLSLYGDATFTTRGYMVYDLSEHKQFMLCMLGYQDLNQDFIDGEKIIKIIGATLR